MDSICETGADWILRGEGDDRVGDDGNGEYEFSDEEDGEGIGDGVEDKWVVLSSVPASTLLG